MSTDLWRPKPEAYAPNDWNEEVFHAVRAFREGRATEGQQKLAWEWLMYVTGAGERFSDLSARPGLDGPNWTYFAEGKRYVGLQFLKMFSPHVIAAVNNIRRQAAEAEARSTSRPMAPHRYRPSPRR